MKFKYLIIFFSFFVQTSFATSYQYFLSPYFYQNSDSYQMNGMIRVTYNIGKLFDMAANKIKNESNQNIFIKCTDSQKTDIIFHLYPESFYNPKMTTFYTDLKVRVFEAPGQLKNIFILKHQTHKQLWEYPQDDISKHYEELIRKLVKTTTIESINFKVDGSLCNLFS